MNVNNLQIKPLILLGAGGHAKVLLSLIKELNWPLSGVCAPELLKQSINEWRDIKVLDTGDELSDYSPDEFDLINGIGQMVGDNNRRRLFEHFKERGYYFPPLVHRYAWVDSSAILEEGVQVMAGVVIQADSRIGKNSIINTNACIDHDCIIEEHVHIAPGAVLCGGVSVSRGALIASGACLVPGIKIGEEAVVGAGASIAQHVGDRQLVLPASVRCK